LIITLFLRRSLYSSITRICRVCPSIFNCQRPQIPNRTASPARLI
jgi:hypothetical protein